MKKYVITTDNNADLPESYYREHGVGCMYLSYTIDGVHYTHENFMRVPFLFLFRLKIWKKMLTEHKVYSTITQCDIVR